MKFKLNYFLIPVLVFFINSLGSLLHPSYYSLSSLPWQLWAPWVLWIPFVQTLVILLFWNTFPRDQHFTMVLGLFIANFAVQIIGAYVLNLHAPSIIIPSIFVGIQLFIIGGISVGLWTHRLRLAAVLFLIPFLPLAAGNLLDIIKMLGFNPK